jgi:hypothetical protein
MKVRFSRSKQVQRYVLHEGGDAEFQCRILVVTNRFKQCDLRRGPLMHRFLRLAANQPVLCTGGSCVFT